MISSRSSMTLWLSLTALSLMWGSSYLFIKLAIAELPPFALAAARAGVAATALAIGFAIARQSIHFSWKQLIPMIVLGTTNGWLPNALTAFASLSLDTAKIGMISASSPLFTFLMAPFLVAEEWLDWHKLMGIAVGFLGIFLLIGPDNVMAGQESLTGSLLVVVVAFCYALGTIYGRLQRSLDPVQLALGQQICSGFGATLLSLIFDPFWKTSLSVSVSLSLLALGVVCTAAPGVLLLWSLRRFQATNVSMLSYLIPLWAAVLGVFVLGERLSLTSITGCVIILSSVWIVNRKAVSSL